MPWFAWLARRPGLVPVPNASTRTVAVRGGAYRLFVRYGQPGKYRFTRGDPITITHADKEFEEVIITLQTMVDGNYRTSPSDEAEFNGNR